MLGDTLESLCMQRDKTGESMHAERRIGESTNEENTPMRTCILRESWHVNIHTRETVHAERFTGDPTHAEKHTLGGTLQ